MFLTLFGFHLIIFSIANTIERYQRRVKETGLNHKRDDNSQVIITLYESLILVMLRINSHSYFGWQQARDEIYGLTKKIEQLEISKRFGTVNIGWANYLLIWIRIISCNLYINCRKLLGEGIDACSIEELQQLENQLERGLTRIRAKKVNLIDNHTINVYMIFYIYIYVEQYMSFY